MTAGSMGDLPGNATSPDVLVKATGGASSGKPTVYVYLTRSKVANLPSVRLCQQIESEMLFTGDPAACKPRESSTFDFRAALAARAFHVVKVEAADSSSFKPPVVVITNSKGQVKHHLTGPNITAAAMYSAMAGVMKEEGKDISKPVAKAAGIASKLYSIQVEIEKVKVKLATHSTATGKQQMDSLTKAKQAGDKALGEALAEMKG